MQISSMKDIARAAMVQGAYDDEINGIFVPDQLALHEENAAERIFVFIHECGHALSVQQNPKLKQTKVTRLMQSKTRRIREKGYVSVAFEEGLATHLAIQACLGSGRTDLVAYAGRVHKKLVDFFVEWISPSERNFALMAKVCKADPHDWQKVIGWYFGGDSMEVGLEYYKYDIGYYFIRTLKPDTQMILQMIQQPPSTVQHILYPEIYRSEKLVRN